MPAKLRVSDYEKTYSEVKNDESNVLHQLTVWDQRNKFFTHLHENETTIQAITAHHLGLKVQDCQLAGPEEWRYGSYNACIPIYISSGKKQSTTKRVMIRFPLPYKVGGPENGDEKLRCEAATYIWLQQNCPSVPIPRLHGFGLSTGQKFTAIEHLPLPLRLAHQVYRWLRNWFKLPVLSRFIRRQVSLDSFGTGYLLIDYIEKSTGQMLSYTWKERHEEKDLRQNLFQGLSRILLELSRVPLPRIGSFTVDDNGFLRLANRPLLQTVHQLENEQIPVDIPRQLTYTSVDSYVIDTLNGLHDSRLSHQLNGATDERDCIYQMSALAAMKSISSLFLRRDLRNGPFFFSLTDLHASNIFVDDKWNITCVLDLEWAFSCPVEMIHPPRWLANQAIDEMDKTVYDPRRLEFMDAMETAERELSIPPSQGLSMVMKQAWERGTFWYTLALQSPSGLARVFYDHIQPIMANGHEENVQFYLIMAEYWSTEKVIQFVERKQADKEEYDKRLRQAFDDPAEDSVAAADQPV